MTLVFMFNKNKGNNCTHTHIHTYLYFHQPNFIPFYFMKLVLQYFKSNVMLSRVFKLEWTELAIACFMYVLTSLSAFCTFNASHDISMKYVSLITVTTPKYLYFYASCTETVDLCQEHNRGSLSYFFSIRKMLTSRRLLSNGKILEWLKIE